MDVIDVPFIYILNCLKYSFFYITVFIKNEPMITFYQLSNGINEFLVSNNVLMHVLFVFLSWLVPKI